jgi:sigma-B regulation protein RsbU (phosphoserine phosphatase)
MLRATVHDEEGRFGFRSVTTRLIVWVLLCCGLVFLVTLGVSHAQARARAVESAEREARSAAEGAARRVGEVLRAVEAGTGLIAAAVEALDPPPARLDALLRRVVSEHPAVHGVVVAFPPAAGRPPAAPFARRGAEAPGVMAGDLARDGITHGQRPWFTEAAALRAPRWFEPQDAPTGGGVPVVTYGVPVLHPARPDGGLRAVVLAELDLNWLDALAREIRAGASGFAVILSGQGRILAHPEAALIGHRMLEEIPADRRAAVEPLVRRMLAGDSAFEPLALQGRTFRLAFAPVERAGWSLAVLYPEDELLAGVHRLRLLQAGLASAGLVALAGVVVALSRRITRPLRALSETAARLATGLDQELPVVRSRDELGALSRAFHHMRDSLRDHVRELQQATAARERLDSELRVARRIQFDMLAEPHASGQGFELSAALVPARAVGGDLYDHFLRGGRLFFLVGDVSGKGVAAALFMARARALLQSIAAREPEPGAMLAQLNRGLCTENEAGMYLTAVLCALDPRSGDLAFACAGHEPPVRVPVHGAPVPLRTEGGPVLGLLDAGDFPVDHVALASGDTLVLYSDGVSEAQDKAGEFFGPDRLRAAVVGAGQAGTTPVAERLLGAVRAFAGEAPQSDDITVLVARFVGERQL